MGVEKLVLIEWNKENTREKVMLNMNDNKQHRWTGKLLPDGK